MRDRGSVVNYEVPKRVARDAPASANARVSEDARLLTLGRLRGS
jgi:hypothetical protein